MDSERGKWYSPTTGIAAADQIYYAHKGRLECIERARNELGRLRHAYGFSIDSLPADINAARDALRVAYHAELARKPATVPPCDGHEDDA